MEGKNRLGVGCWARRRRKKDDLSFSFAPFSIFSNTKSIKQICTFIFQTLNLQKKGSIVHFTSTYFFSNSWNCSLRIKNFPRWRDTCFLHKFAQLRLEMRKCVLLRYSAKYLQAVRMLFPLRLEIQRYVSTSLPYDSQGEHVVVVLVVL